MAALQPSFFMEEIMIELIFGTVLVTLWTTAGIGMLHETFRD